MSNDPDASEESGEGDGGGDAVDEGSTAVPDDEVEPQVEAAVEPELSDGESADGETGQHGTQGRAKAHDEKFCESCGEAIKKQAELCPHCGVRVGTDSAPAAGTAERTSETEQTAGGADGQGEGEQSATTAPDEVFCGACGKPIKKAAEVCPHCGVRNTGETTGNERGGADEEGEKFCGSCGEQIRKDAELCPHCGVRTANGAKQTGSDGNDEVVAAVISFVVPGGGQLYNGQMERGVAILVSYIAFWIVTILAMFVVIGFLLVFLAPLFHVGAAWDAFVQAQQRNAAEDED